MFGQTIGTIASRVIVTGFNLLVVMLAGHHLGAEGLGDIGLIVLAITFIMLVNNLVGGGAIVYLVPRHALRRLLAIAYGWAMITGLLAAAILQFAPLVPAGAEIHVAVLALFQAITTVHLGVLLGRQRLRTYNALQAAQAALLAGAFIMLLHRTGGPSTMTYVQAAYVAFGTTALLSSVAVVLRGTAVPAIAPTGSLMANMVRQGGFMQGANLLQLLNYRLAYYLIEGAHGLAALGIYSVGNQLAESAWLGPRSLGTVLYGRVSTTPDAARQIGLTLITAKASVLLAMTVLLVLLVLPDVLFQQLFGSEVVGVNGLILLLTPGILAMAASQAFSHYFSGVGRNVHNMLGSGLGLFATLGLGLWLIPLLGARGAAITASGAYSLNVFYQIAVFLRSTRTSLRSLLPGPIDMERLKQLLPGARR